VAGVPGPPRPPNHPKTIHKPPTREREAAGDEEAEKILAAYPPDRLRGKATCLAQIEEAMKEGITPEDLRQAVQAYATDSAGFTRSKVCFSDNWFQSERWRAYVEKQAEDREKAKVLEADHHARLACWISDRSPMCKHISAPQVTALLASKLVTEAQIEAAGLRA
jgi:tagatose-1,6-bisphosphate aldolase non-catalytic subunit AgaZ/GatZ